MWRLMAGLLCCQRSAICLYTSWHLQPMPGQYPCGSATGYKVLNWIIPHPVTGARPCQPVDYQYLNGNLRSSADSNQATYNKIISNTAFTTNSGANGANSSALLSELDQWGPGGLTGFESGKILISGIKEDGTTFEKEEITWGPDADGRYFKKISACLITALRRWFERTYYC